MATNVLKYLAMASFDGEGLRFDTKDVYRGGQHVHREISERFKPDQPLSVVCAFTPNPGITRILSSIVPERTMLPLTPVPAAELDRLAERIFALYSQAWPALEPPMMHRRLITGRLSGAFRRHEIETTRQAARLVVEFWDIYRHSPERALTALMG
jgi:hypothetical protein